MSEPKPAEWIAAALARYREIQDAEGATGADEGAIARAQGAAWRVYVELCRKNGVSPESSDGQNPRRY